MKEIAKKMGETAMESRLQDRQRYNAYKRQRKQASLQYPMVKRGTVYCKYPKGEKLPTNKARLGQRHRPG